MASINKTFLMGNLGNDPETVGKDMVKFSLATSYGTGDKEKTEWHRIVAFGKTGEIAAAYLTKGSPVHVEGRIQYGSYEDKEGIKRYTTDIVAERITLLGKKAAGEEMPF